MIGVNASTPKDPRFVTVKVPPCISAAVSRPWRARSARSCARAATSRKLNSGTSRMTGTSSPASVSTAMPTWARRATMIRSPSQRELSAGCCRSAAAASFTRKSV